MGRSCGGERKVGAPGPEKMPSWLLLSGRAFIRPPSRFSIALAPILAAVAVSKPPTLPEASALLAVAFPVAVHLSHHRRRPVLVLIDTHRKIAQHVFVQSLLAFQLLQRR